MTPTSSPRLGLIVDTLNETDINTNQPNWDRVDYASGYTATKKTTSVPVASQFDGQLVAQTDTAITWYVTPGNTKRWQNYPYLIKLSADHSSGFTNNLVSVNFWHTKMSGGVNDNAADFTGGTWVVPVKGIYELEYMCKWAATTAGGYRLTGIQVNGSNQSAWEKVNNAIQYGWPTMNLGKELVWLSAGDVLKPYFFQNSGGVLGATNVYFKARLVRPLI